MNADVMKVIGIIGVLLVLGLIFKDSGEYGTAIKASSGAFADSIKALSGIG